MYKFIFMFKVQNKSSELRLPCIYEQFTMCEVKLDFLSNKPKK